MEGEQELVCDLSNGAISNDLERTLTLFSESGFSLFADFDQRKPFAEAHRANIEDLEHELHQAKRLVERIGDSSTDSAALYCKPTTFVGLLPAQQIQ